MVLVRGHDRYVGVEIAPEQTWGTTALVNWERVWPFLEETLTVEAQPLPRPQHLGAGDALTTYDTGRQLVRGSITIYPSYNAKFLHYLLGQGHGGIEFAIPDKTPASNGVTGYHSHVYWPQVFTAVVPGAIGGVGNGFTIRAWKSGPDTTGYCDTFSGCIVTKMTFEQPDEDRPRWTFEFIGYTCLTGKPGTSTGPITRASAQPAANNAAAAWTTPNNAHTDDVAYATATTTNSPLIFNSFANIAAKAGTAATVGGITVTLKGKKTDPGGPNTLTFDVEYSVDGGSTWSNTKSTTALATTDTTFTLGTNTDLWGLTPTLAQITGANLRVRITNKGTTTGGPTWHLQYFQINVSMWDTELRAAQSDIVEIGLRDYENRPTDANLPGICKVGRNDGSSHNLTSIETRGFTVRVDAHIEVPPPFLTSFDSVEKPGHIDKWECSGEIRSFLQDDYDAANRPHNMMRNKYNGAFRVRYVSNTNVGATGTGYSMDLFFPMLTWEAVEDPVNDPIPTARWAFQTAKDVQPGVLSSEWAAGVTLSNTTGIPWIIQTGNATSTAIGFSVAESGEESNTHELTSAVAQNVEWARLTKPAVSNNAAAGWTSPNNAHADDSSTADTSTLDGAIIYADFDFSDIPADAAVDTITVRVDGKKDEALGSGTMQFEVDLSYDGGTSWTTGTRTDNLTTSLATYQIGGTFGRFGRDWVGDELSTSNFRVRVTPKASAVVDDPAWNLEYLEVSVLYNAILVIS